MPSHDNKIRLTHSLIRRYFDGNTSLDQEKQLRELLADNRLSSPEIEEARAVIGFFAAEAAATAPAASRRRQRVPSLLKIAAALVALLSAAAVTVATFSASDPSPRCIAYINGTTISDTDKVMELLEADFRIAAETAAAVNERIETGMDNIEQIILYSETAD